VERFVVVLIYRVLHRFVGRTTRGASIADFGHVVQASTPGWYQAGGGDSDVVDGQRTSLVFEVKKEGPAGGRLEPGAVVIGGVVVADRGMVSAYGEIDIVAGRIFEEHARHIHTDRILWSY